MALVHVCLHKLTKGSLVIEHIIELGVVFDSVEKVRLIIIAKLIVKIHVDLLRKIIVLGFFISEQFNTMNKSTNMHHGRVT